MKVDGAKTLTSRGQQDWLGFKQMTRKFEQEYTSGISYMFSSSGLESRPSQGNKKEMSAWVDKVLSESKWGVKTPDAHLK